MFEVFSDTQLLALFGLGGGCLLGLAARLGRFCTLGAIEDVAYGGSGLRMRMWGVALATAIIGTSLADAAGLASVEKSMFLLAHPTVAASIVGGLMFGYGMALAGNCGFGALARLGGGDLRSFVIVLVMGLSTYILLGGPLAALRVAVFDAGVGAAPTESLGQSIARLTGIHRGFVGLVIGGLILALSIWRNLNAEMAKAAFWGALVGVAIVSGWLGTSYVSAYGFADPMIVSHTFSAPVGETILYLMTSSGNSLSFGIGSVVGVLLGAFIGSMFMGHFRWEACDDPRELRRQILGAALMGSGAVIAVGCSVGQGLSAFSVLAPSAPLTFGAIVIGALVGLHQLINGFSEAA